MTMISNMPRYEQMKDSGVEWLGEIPVGWQVRKIKYLFKIGRGRVISQQELDELAVYPVYSSQTQDNGVLGYIHSYDFDCKQITWTTDGANAGTIFLRDGKYSCTNVCGTLKPLSEKFSLEFCEKSLSVAAQYYKRPDTNGAKIMNGEMAEIFITFPSLPEQIAIANFLDQKTAQIDQAIALKQKQIDLFKERKQLVIQQAVTKGLNPHAPMRDSGVEWIGEIPEHWEVLKLSHIARIDSGATPDRTRANYWNGDIPWVKTGEVNYTDILETEEYITKAGLKNSSTKLASSGTLLMAMYGQGITRGRVALLGIPATYNQACCGITFKSNFINRFTLNFFIAAYPYIRDAGNETSQMNLSTSYIATLKIVCPPLEEQTAIVAHIETQSAKIDKAIDIQQQQIHKLKEYKATLINSAVTGKIKVV